jgi:hypothetical protein
MRFLGFLLLFSSSPSSGAQIAFFKIHFGQGMTESPQFECLAWLATEILDLSPSFLVNNRLPVCISLGHTVWSGIVLED